MTAFLIGSPPGAITHMLDVSEPPIPVLQILEPQPVVLFSEIGNSPKTVKIWTYKLHARSPLGVTYKFVG